MKKLGLRVLAGSLAALMVASTFTPAKSASAADDLLIAPAPISVKTLYITEDMVDEDGEIVISGENWERVVVSKEVAADKIYFDQVTVGELVVESGSKTNIELWGVDAEKLTVQEPEIKKLSLNELLPLLADKETQQAAIDTYLKNKTENERALNTAPSIVTKEDAKVDTLVVRANATLNLETGEVGAVALEASDKLERAKVTLKNYNGDVTYKGGENFNSMTLKNVDSRIKTLTVDESSANNYFNVTAKNSVVLKAEVAGNAQVSLNAPMGTIEITEAASAAQVCVLNVADEMKVAANGAKVQVAMSGSVAAATITGNNVNIGGEGSLSEVEITGKGAYVTTNGTKVEGENTYVKPVYVEKPEDLEYNFAALSAGGYGNERVDVVDGGVVYKLNGNYGGEVTYVLPKAVDACYYKEAVIKVKTASDDDKVTVKLTAEGAETDQWKNPIPFYSKVVSGETEVVVPLGLHAGKMIEQVRFQSTGNPATVTFYSVTFKLNENGPVDPIVPPADGTLCTPGAWEIVAFQDVDFRQYAGKTVKITLEAMSLGGSSNPVAHGQFANGGWVMIHGNKEIGTEWTDFGAEAFEVPASFATSTEKIYYGIRTLSPTTDYSGSLIYYRNFSVEVVDGGNEGGNQGGNTPTPIPTLTYKASELTLGGYGHLNRETKEDGSVIASYDGNGYYELSFTLPENISLVDYSTLVIEMSTTAGVYVKTYDSAPLQGAYGDLAYQEQWTNTTSSKTVDLRTITVAAYTDAGKTYENLSLAKVSIMTLQEAADVTVTSITIIPAE